MFKQQFKNLTNKPTLVGPGPSGLQSNNDSVGRNAILSKTSDNPNLPAFNDNYEPVVNTTNKSSNIIQRCAAKFANATSVIPTVEGLNDTPLEQVVDYDAQLCDAGGQPDTPKVVRRAVQWFLEEHREESGDLRCGVIPGGIVSPDWESKQVAIKNPSRLLGDNPTITAVRREHLQAVLLNSGIESIINYHVDAVTQRVIYSSSAIREQYQYVKRPYNPTNGQTLSPRWISKSGKCDGNLTRAYHRASAYAKCCQRVLQSQGIKVTFTRRGISRGAITYDGGEGNCYTKHFDVGTSSRFSCSLPLQLNDVCWSLRLWYAALVEALGISSRVTKCRTLHQFSCILGTLESTYVVATIRNASLVWHWCPRTDKCGHQRFLQSFGINTISLDDHYDISKDAESIYQDLLDPISPVKNIPPCNTSDVNGSSNISACGVLISESSSGSTLSSRSSSPSSNGNNVPTAQPIRVEINETRSVVLDSPKPQRLTRRPQSRSRVTSDEEYNSSDSNRERNNVSLASGLSSKLQALELDQNGRSLDVPIFENSLSGSTDKPTNVLTLADGGHCSSTEEGSGAATGEISVQHTEINMVPKSTNVEHISTEGYDGSVGSGGGTMCSDGWAPFTEDWIENHHSNVDSKVREPEAEISSLYSSESDEPSSPRKLHSQRTQESIDTSSCSNSKNNTPSIEPFKISIYVCGKLHRPTVEIQPSRIVELFPELKETNVSHGIKIIVSKPVEPSGCICKKLLQVGKIGSAKGCSTNTSHPCESTIRRRNRRGRRSKNDSSATPEIQLGNRSVHTQNRKTSVPIERPRRTSSNGQRSQLPRASQTNSASNVSIPMPKSNKYGHFTVGHACKCGTQEITKPILSPSIQPRQPFAKSFGSNDIKSWDNNEWHQVRVSRRRNERRYDNSTRELPISAYNTRDIPKSKQQQYEMDNRRGRFHSRSQPGGYWDNDKFDNFSSRRRIKSKNNGTSLQSGGCNTLFSQPNNNIRRKNNVSKPSQNNGQKFVRNTSKHEGGLSTNVVVNASDITSGATYPRPFLRKTGNALPTEHKTENRQSVEMVGVNLSKRRNGDTKNIRSRPTSPRNSGEGLGRASSGAVISRTYDSLFTN